MSEHPAGSPGSNLLPVLMAVLCAAGFIIFMVLVSGGFFVYVLVAVAAMGGVGALHYLLWGHALEQEVSAERDALAARERREAEEQAFPPRRNYPDEHRHGIRER